MWRQVFNLPGNYGKLKTCRHLGTDTWDEAAGEVPTAKQAPHRPGTAPALGLRAGSRCLFIISRTNLEKETLIMWFQSGLNSLEFGSARNWARRARRGAPRKRAAACKLLLELLENRTVPSTISLMPNEAAPQLVGERITWTATVTDGPAAPVFQFSDGPALGPSHVVRDFSTNNTFT